ncbi:hypothetical protein Ancab_018910 [Ancistrocladus abbreviatus]
MDPDPKHHPLLSFILSQQTPNLTSTPYQPDPILVSRMPCLTHPQVIQSMKDAISDVIQAKLLLKPLGDRPTSAAVAAARSRITVMESKLIEDLEAVKLGELSSENEELRREEADREMQIYKAVVRLDEMHEEYAKKLNEAEERLPKVYRTVLRELGIGGGDVEEEINEEVVSILKKAAAGEAVERVELPGRELRFLPECFGKLHHLVLLNLSNNQLEVLPDLIAGLQKLEVLNVSSNLLTFLPDSIGLLLKLKVLNVSGNKLNTLPESITACSSLEELNASFNNLTCLPMNIGYGLLNLKKLYLSLNKIRFLPPSICEMKSLQYLDAHFNTLHSLPNEIGRLTNLDILNVSGNFSDLTELPESICSLINLKELDLSNNQIHSLPDAFYRLDSLVKLNLDGNPLIIPPLEFAEKGAEAVKEHMEKRWLSMVAEEQQRSIAEANREAQPGWPGWNASWLSNLVSGVSQTLSGHFGGTKDYRDPYLDQQL